MKVFDPLQMLTTVVCHLHILTDVLRWDFIFRMPPYTWFTI